MAFDIQVTNPQLHPNVVPHRIAPVRFARAVRGFTDIEAPDLDDRGFVLPRNFGTALGPVVGVRRNQTIRIKVIRDRLEPTTQIFPTVDDNTIVTLEHPSPGTALNPNVTLPDPADPTSKRREGDCIYLHGASTSSEPQMTKVKLHYRAADGPVLAEIAVRVYPPIQINVQAHSVTVNGTTPTTTVDIVRRIFRRVSAIYAQAGVSFTVNSSLQTHSITLNTAITSGAARLPGAVLVTNPEMQTVFTLTPNNASSLNVFYIPLMQDPNDGSSNPFDGFGVPRSKLSAGPFVGFQVGLMVVDLQDLNQAAALMAHEIGHVLNLEHYDNGQRPNGIRNDIWGHRNLMHNFVNLITSSAGTETFPNSPARAQVGYGAHNDGRIRNGQWLGTKQLTKIFQGDQINVLRSAAARRLYFPV